MLEYDPKVSAAIKDVDLSDIEKDSVCMFQLRVSPYFNLFMCFLFPFSSPAMDGMKLLSMVS